MRGINLLFKGIAGLFIYFSFPGSTDNGILVTFRKYPKSIKIGKASKLCLNKKYLKKFKLENLRVSNGS